MKELCFSDCKGRCLRHKAIKPIGRGRYAIGQKQCQVCCIFIKWEVSPFVVATNFEQETGEIKNTN